MKKILGIVVLFLLNVSVQAQSKNELYVGFVVSDSASLASYRSIDGLSSILESENKIEIRFITYPIWGDPTYTILSYNKKWQCRSYYKDSASHQYKSYLVEERINLDTVFAMLVDNHVFSLPDFSELNTDKSYYNLKTGEVENMRFMVYDGVTYVVEFKVGNQYRRYRYSNPKSYYEFNPLPELAYFLEIQMIFGELEVI